MHISAPRHVPGTPPSAQASHNCKPLSLLSYRSILLTGGIYEFFAYYYNLEHVSNAVALWLGMRPADIFVYVFLPPFLLDLSVRIDFFMLKKARTRGKGATWGCGHTFGRWLLLPCRAHAAAETAAGGTAGAAVHDRMGRG